MSTPITGKLAEQGQQPGAQIARDTGYYDNRFGHQFGLELEPVPAGLSGACDCGGPIAPGAVGGICGRIPSGALTGPRTKIGLVVSALKDPFSLSICPYCDRSGTCCESLLGLVQRIWVLLISL